MATHELSITLPKREIGKADVVFEVRRDGKPFGTLRVSKGAMVWDRGKGRRMRGRARGAKVTSQRTWAQFDAWMGGEDGQGAA